MNLKKPTGEIIPVWEKRDLGRSIVSGHF